MTSLTISQLYKAYGETAVLQGLDLHCRGGEIHGLLGQNGSGKSTVCKILSGVTPMAAGEIRIDGQKIRLETPQDAKIQGIYTVFQELSVLPNLSVAENLLIRHAPRTILGTIAYRRMLDEAEYHLRRLGLARLPLRQRVGELTIADRQLLEVAKALIHEPMLLILDEASSSLPPDAAEWLFSHASRIARNGGIVLFTSHRLQEIEQYADRLSILRNGVRVAEARKGEYETDELVTQMLGYKVDQLYPPAAVRDKSTPVLTLRQFTVGHQVHQVDLTVHQGEIFGIAAMPGQGQRELFYGIFGELKSQGQRLVDGTVQHWHSPQQAVQAGLCLIPEDRKTEGLLLPKAIGHNLSVVILDRLARMGLIEQSLESQQVTNTCQQLNIDPRRLKEPVANLSGGNQQKVVLGKMLLAKPRCLLLYDCTRGVDVGTKAEIYRVMVDLAQSGVGILFYTSDLQEMVNLADRVAVLFEGRIVQVLEPPHLSEEQILHAAFGSTRAAVEAFQEVGC